VNKLNSKQKKILDDIFKEPIKSDVLWKDIENILEALGAEISEGNGSRIRIFKWSTSSISQTTSKETN
jgi:ABC-type phosphate transport system ATPase subunit